MAYQCRIERKAFVMERVAFLVGEKEGPEGLRIRRGWRTSWWGKNHPVE
jgi:hypothetical protein